MTLEEVQQEINKTKKDGLIAIQQQDHQKLIECIRKLQKYSHKRREYGDTEDEAQAIEGD